MARGPDSEHRSQSKQVSMSPDCRYRFTMSTSILLVPIRKKELTWRLQEQPSPLPNNSLT